MAFAEADFALSVKLEDGCTKREHLVSAWEQSGIEPDELRDAPPCPVQLLYLWEHFVKLDARRTNNGFGPMPLLHSEVYSWQKLYRIKLDGRELDALFKIDGLYMASRAKAEGKPNVG